ncbi:histidine phosphatase superfamily [Phaeosphaeria sp. MPI-PUGE-AT-0046c]|nr:histidine phosphatase superfamily [Phaeosphaeria sp. MPI-PUGE-AT-0046c]
MARTMRLFLIRHGETVDNVAGLYAGIRDSELTNHGYQQAARLGMYYHTIGLRFTHLFSSHLQRAAKTAGKIREAQFAQGAADVIVPDVVQLPLLAEQNFGSMEGKKFYGRPLESKMTGKEHRRQQNKGMAGFVDVESKDAMAQRADTFLDAHLLPLLDDTTETTQKCVAIVSHGIFLSTLWKRLLLRLPARSVVLSPELQATARPSLEHLGGWSNTGFLELQMVNETESFDHSAPGEPSTHEAPPSPPPTETPAAKSLDEIPAADNNLGKVFIPQISVESAISDKASEKVSDDVKSDTVPTPPPRLAKGWSTTVLSINGKDHLKGLKRTGGGVGSSRHDTSQVSIETFFKRRKVD